MKARLVGALVVGALLGASPAFAAAFGVTSGKIAVFTNGVAIATTDVAITFPAPGGIYNAATFDAGCVAAGFCGTASAGDGISRVEISIRQSGGNYWNGTSFGSPTEQLLLAAGAETWSLAFPASNLPSGSYVVNATATATGGATGAASATFTIDKGAPAASITFPANGAVYNQAALTAGCGTPGTSDLCGTASDPQTSVADVKVSLRQAGGNYWNGTGFSSATEQLLSVGGTTSWTFGFPTASFPASGSYVLRAVATDAAGNTGAASATFTFDRDAPIPGVAFPTAGAFYNAAGFNAGCSTGGGDLCGTATDVGSSITDLRVSVRQGSANYWSGSGFASPTEVLLASIGLPSWTLSFAGSNFAVDGNYTVRAQATDGAGNLGSESRTFTIDNTAPAGTDVQTANKTAGIAGRAEQGDTVTFTFSEQMSAPSIVAGWDGTARNIVVRILNGTGQGNDLLAFYDATNTTQLPLGTVDLGDKTYNSANGNTVVTFGASGTASTMTISGSQIVIILGTASATTVGTVTANTAMIWTTATGPTDRAGNPLSTAVVNETGTADREF